MSSPNQIPKSLHLEREGREFYLWTRNYRDQQELTWVRILSFGYLLWVFLGSQI